MAGTTAASDEGHVCRVEAGWSDPVDKPYREDTSGETNVAGIRYSWEVLRFGNWRYKVLKECKTSDPGLSSGPDFDLQRREFVSCCVVR